MICQVHPLHVHSAMSEPITTSQVKFRSSESQAVEQNVTIHKCLKKVKNAEVILQTFKVPSKPKSLGRTIMIKCDTGEKTTTSLEIDFRDNLITTFFKGERKTVAIGAALQVIRNFFLEYDHLLKDIQEYPVQTTSKRLLNHTVTVHTSSSSFKQPLPFYQLSDGTVSKENLSIPFETFRNCSHLFDRNFVSQITTKLGKDSSLTPYLASLIHDIYIGRCILGFQQSLYMQSNSEKKLNTEAERILQLIKKQGCSFYTAPLA